MKTVEQKSNAELLRDYQELLKDSEYLDGRADDLGYGAAGEYFRLAASDARAAAELIRRELESRRVLQ